VFAVLAKKMTVFKRGFAREDRTGRFYNTGTFDKCVTAVLPIMALASGTCQLIDNSEERLPLGAGPQTRARSECLNMDNFTTTDWKNAQRPPIIMGPLPRGRIDLHRLRLTIMDIAMVTEETFKEDELRQMMSLEKEFTKKKKDEHKS